MENLFLEKYGYRFNDPNLLKTALNKSSEKFKCLELVGNDILASTISEKLYDMYDVSTIHETRMNLTNNETLKKTFDNISLINFLLEHHQAHIRYNPKAKIRADYVEAIFGAIYLDSHNIEIVWHFIVKWIIETNSWEKKL